MFLRIFNDGSFGFVTNGIHQITETDIHITEEDYNNFFEFQNNGKQFRLKETTDGDGLFGYLEEYKAEIIIDTTPTTEERLKALELTMLEVL